MYFIILYHMLWNCFLIFYHTYTFLWTYAYQNVLRLQKQFCLITWYKIVSDHTVQNCIICYDTFLFHLIYDTKTCYITQYQHDTIWNHSIILYHNTCYDNISFYLYDTILIKLHDILCYYIKQYCITLHDTILYHIKRYHIVS